jgi:hypothetical protein
MRARRGRDSLKVTAPVNIISANAIADPSHASGPVQKEEISIDFGRSASYS